MSKRKTYQDVSADALPAQIQKREEELRQLRFQVSTNQMKSVRTIRAARKDVARLHTALRLKESL